MAALGVTHSPTASVAFEAAAGGEGDGCHGVARQQPRRAESVRPRLRSRSCFRRVWCGMRRDRQRALARAQVHQGDLDWSNCSLPLRIRRRIENIGPVRQTHLGGPVCGPCGWLEKASPVESPQHAFDRCGWNGAAHRGVDLRDALDDEARTIQRTGWQVRGQSGRHLGAWPCRWCRNVFAGSSDRSSVQGAHRVWRIHQAYQWKRKGPQAGGVTLPLVEVSMFAFQGTQEACSH